MDFTFHNGTNGSDPWVEFYPYVPSAVAGYTFVALFGVSTLSHFGLIFLFRAAFFIPLVIGGIAETFGYYGRAWSHQDRTEIGSWALQEILVLCAPPFIAATIYMTLGRIIRALDAEHLSSIRPKRITKIFVLNDVLCFLTQLAGAGIQVTGDSQIMDIGMKVVLGGLIFALVVFCGFLWTAAKFHQRLRKDPTHVCLQNTCLAWHRYMWALYIACMAVMIRNLVRTIQFASPKGSTIRQKEVIIYVFDAALMLLAILTLLLYHPGLLLKKLRRTPKPEVSDGLGQSNDDFSYIPLIR